MNDPIQLGGGHRLLLEISDRRQDAGFMDRVRCLVEADAAILRRLV